METILLALLVKSVVVSAFALVVTVALRRFAARHVSAASRHTVGGAAFAAILALPVLSAVLPAWRVALPQTAPSRPRPLSSRSLEKGGVLANGSENLASAPNAPFLQGT